MARVKGGPQGHLRHKKVLNYTKGQRMSRHLLFRRANEAMLKSMFAVVYLPGIAILAVARLAVFISPLPTSKGPLLNPRALPEFSIM